MPIHHDKHGDPLARHSLSPTELKELLEAERTGAPFLVFREDEERLRIIPAGGLGRTLTLGRGAGMDLSIFWDAEVSGLHAELHGLGGEWTIVDDGLSTNGTFVNGQRIRGRVRLRDGDRIRVGHTTLAYRAGRASAPRTTKAAPLWTLQPLTDTQRRVLIALCRPFRDGASFATPATNQQIAAELFLSVDAVKMHLRTLFAKFGLAELPQNEKRARLVQGAMQSGAVSQADLR
jgi:FHA domain/Bacterial regulatory proteins, luxR family